MGALEALQQAQVKWTSTLSSRLLLEVGYAQYQAYRHTTYQPGIDSRTDRRSGSRPRPTATLPPAGCWGRRPEANYYLMPTRRFFSAIGSYVTGSHNIRGRRAGQLGIPGAGHAAERAGCSRCIRISCRRQVTIYNTPERDRFTMNAQWGILRRRTPGRSSA